MVRVLLAVQIVRLLKLFCTRSHSQTSTFGEIFSFCHDF